MVWSTVISYFKHVKTISFNNQRVPYRLGGRSAAVLLAQVFAFSTLCAPHLHASFILNYAVDQFTLTNTNADGTAISPDGGLSLIITGGNNGSGLAGTTDFLTTVQQSGLITFAYGYSSCSPTFLCDDPGFDYAGYILGPNFMQLTDTDGDSGTVSVAVAAGQSFGFRVGTVDNGGEPGILTVSNFSASQVDSAPEPGTLGLVGLAAAVFVVTYMARKRKTESKLDV